MSVFKNYTLEEYTNTHGFEFFVYDDTKEDYAFGGAVINPDSLEWEYLKDELILEFDETLNEILTLIIATIPEEEEPEWWEGLTDEEIKEEWKAYQANLERDERGFHE